MNIFNFFLKKTFQNNSINDPVFRSKIANIQGIFAIIGNIVIFALKLILGLLLNSVSLIADSFHTLSDIISTIIIMIGFKYAKKPADKEHPFGHQRYEFITGIIVSILLIITGFEFLKFSFNKILNPTLADINIFVILIVVFTIIMKEIMAQFALFLGNKIKSSALKADFYHHRIDAVSSIFVIIALISGMFGYKTIDGYMGLIVSLMIMYSGIKILRENSNELLGLAPEEELLNSINNIIEEFKDKGVLGIHDIIINRYGNQIIGSAHIEVDERMDILKAHTISEEIEDTIENRLNIFLTTHIDPLNVHNPLLNEIREYIKNIATQINHIDSVHDIRFIGDDEWLNIAFDISIKKVLNNNEKEIIKGMFEEKLKEKYKKIHAITIKFEQLFSY